MTDTTPLHPLVNLKALADAIDGYGCRWDWLAGNSLTINSAIRFNEPEEGKREDALHDLDPGNTVLLEFGYWDDGEQHPAPATDHPSAREISFSRGELEPMIVTYHEVSLTYRQLTDALHAMADGKVSRDRYQIAAATDLIHQPDDADGDADTTDLLTQWATFGELVYS